MFKQLRPVGEPIVLQGASQTASEVLRRRCGGEVTLVNSGTAALALALLSAKARADVESPNVLIPAYACPDLVSAADYAGVTPRLVDFEPDRPWMRLAALEDALDGGTVAIVAVNFLGIPERTAAIRECIAGRPVTLIEDCAQSLPEKPVSQDCDFRILSFGRGKPVGLLHGGALLSSMRRPMPGIVSVSDSGRRFGRLGYGLKASAFNVLMHPLPYWLVSRVPFLGIGRTEYTPLLSVKEMRPEVAYYLPANIARYEARTLSAQRQLRSVIGEIAEITDVAVECGIEDDVPLLRYPVLMPDPVAKKKCLQNLDTMGASGMYPSVLPGIRGVIVQGAGRYPNAEAFAERLLTLPVHRDVSADDIEQVGRLLERSINAG